MYLAIGFSAEHEGFCGSRTTKSNNANTVEKFMYDEFGVHFDTILLVQNDDVVNHWTSGEDF
jgi:hypothetical protein